MKVTYQGLVSKYPELLTGGNPQAPLFLFGIECGPGWYEIIDLMLLRLSHLKCPSLKVSQIKEKFGILRVYLDYGDVNVNEEIPRLANYIVAEAENASRRICEDCGCGDNSVKTEGRYLLTQCNSCRKKYELDMQASMY